jgi:hypothetical protein
VARADTVERLIPNLRFRFWPGLLWIFGWGVIWLPAGAWAESGGLPYRWERIVPVVLLALASYVVVLVAISRLPMRRLRLGEQLRAGPAGLLAPADIAVIRFASDPTEDFVDACQSGPVCLLTIERVRGRSIQVLLTADDAVHVREWADDKGIPADDPDGRAARDAAGRWHCG